MLDIRETQRCGADGLKEKTNEHVYPIYNSRGL